MRLTSMCQKFQGILLNLLRRLCNFFASRHEFLVWKLQNKLAYVGLQYKKDSFLILACMSHFLLKGVHCYFRKSMDVANVILGRKNAQSVH